MAKVKLSKAQLSKLTGGTSYSDPVVREKEIKTDSEYSDPVVREKEIKN